MMPVKAVLFDLDGTLTDPEAGIIRSIRYSLQQFNPTTPPPTDLRWCIGPPLRESFGTLLGTSDAEQIERAMHWYRDRYSTAGMFENTVYPEIPELLEALRTSGFRLFVATSKPTVYAREILEHFRLLPFFNAVYGSELDGRLSDKAELIAYLLRIEGLRPEQCVMIGDRRHDIVGARTNGLRAIGVTYGYGSVDELQAAGADWLVDQPAALFEVLADQVIS